MLDRARYPLLILALAALCQCSVVDEPSDVSRSVASRVSSVRLFLAAGAKSNTRFEQYSLNENAIFFECGVLRADRNIPQAQGILELDEENAETIIALALEIMGRAAVHKPSSVTQTESSKLVGAGGKVLLNIVTKNKHSAAVNATVREVAIPRSELHQVLLKLTSAVREKVSDERGDAGLCGQTEFFGIPDRAVD